MRATRDTLLTVSEAASEARCSREQMYRLVARGSVHAIRVGDAGSGPLRIPAKEFRAWLYGIPGEAA